MDVFLDEYKTPFMCQDINTKKVYFEHFYENEIHAEANSRLLKSSALPPSTEQSTISIK